MTIDEETFLGTIYFLRIHCLLVRTYVLYTVQCTLGWSVEIVFDRSDQVN